MRMNEQESKPIHRNYSKLLISESPLQVLPTLAVKVGLNEALMLQQVHYWISNPMNKNVRNGRVWVYKTYAEWQQEFPFWSLPTIKRTSLNLEQLGLLIASDKFNRLSTDRTKWYTIDYDKLDSLEIGTEDQNDTLDGSKRSTGGINLIPSIPETTPEITTENNNRNGHKVIEMPNKEKRLHVEHQPIVQPEPQSKPKAEPIQEYKLEPNGSVVVNSEIDDLLRMVKGWAISKVMLETWAKKHGVAYVLKKIELTKSAVALNRVRQPGAYLNKAIELDWQPPAPPEDEETKNKPVGQIYPTPEENVAWYNSLANDEKLEALKVAIYKNAYFEDYLKNAKISVLDVGFSKSTWFKMLMSCLGRAV